MPKALEMSIAKIWDSPQNSVQWAFGYGINFVRRELMCSVRNKLVGVLVQRNLVTKVPT